MSCAVEQHLAGQLGRRHRLVHPVEDAQEGRLAAAGRPDQRGDRLGRHGQRDPVQHLVRAEPGRDAAGLQRRASPPARHPGRLSPIGIGAILESRSRSPPSSVDRRSRVRRRPAPDRASPTKVYGRRTCRDAQPVEPMPERCRLVIARGIRACVGRRVAPATGRGGHHDVVDARAGGLAAKVQVGADRADPPVVGVRAEHQVGTAGASAAATPTGSAVPGSPRDSSSVEPFDDFLDGGEAFRQIAG